MASLFRRAWSTRPAHHLLRPTRIRNVRFYADQPSARVSRLESRLPNFLKRYITPLRNAPVSHITAFFILHELTAVVPLIGLTGLFHYSGWLPPYISEGKWVSEYQQKLGNWMRMKGWIGKKEDGRTRWWGRGEKGVKIVIEAATAYAIVKVLLPVRLIGSLWATPWFARWTVVPFTGWLGRMVGFGKAKKTVGSGKGAVDAAGTGAVGGGVLPKSGK